MAVSTAHDRLGRLLALVPWVASEDGPLVTDVCERFALSQRELLADLELLFVCGVHPFTPDTLVDVDVADGRVWIRFADWFRRPLRLTAPEGLALVSTASTLLEVPGSDPDGALARALGKLETVLGVAADDAVDVELGPVSAPTLDAVRRATDEQRCVELGYYSFGTDRSSTRVVEPWRVFNALGQWYLQGHCRQVDGERLFRVDRITSARVLDEPAPPPPPAGPPSVFSADPDDPLVVVDLAPPAQWIAEAYPHEGVVRTEGGTLRVALRSTGDAWLARLLLRAGPDATVVEGDAGAAAVAARRILARYDTGDGAAG